ncbi:MAG: HAD-IA family hydrolase [Propionibacteriaceae bacterium]|nr:HAD-IA family hydrolase [Propionibacteriaceae bacterium]
MTPRWPVVIFDIDGTLVNSVDLIVDSYQHTFRTILGHEWDVTEIKTWIGKSLRGVFEEKFPDQADAMFDEYSRWNDTHTAESITGYDGMPQLVADLVASGARVGAATSKRREPARWALELGGLEALVPLTIAHEDVDAHKPDPAPLLAAAIKLGATPDHVVYVGDAVVDIQAAHNAGMDSVGVTWGAGTLPAMIAAQPNALVDTVAELRAVLLR